MNKILISHSTSIDQPAMKDSTIIQLCLSLLLSFLSFSDHSQYGFIELKNGDLMEIADSQLSLEKGQLKYWKEKVDRSGFSIYGINSKAKKAEYLSKIGSVDIEDVKIIHMQGELSVGNKFVDKFIGYRYVKEGKRDVGYYVIVDGPCNLLIKAEDSNATYSYYVKKRDEEPFTLHLYGVGVGPKLKSRSKKFFSDCTPALAQIDSHLKNSTVHELDIYNSQCAK